MRRSAALVLAALCALGGASACSSSGSGASVATVATAPVTAPDPPTTGSVPTTTERVTTSTPGTTTTSTTTTSTTSTSTTTTSTTSTSTTTTTPPTTLPHGAGVVEAFADATPVPGPVAATARAVYEAAIRHDFDALRLLTGTGQRRFTSGFPGQAGVVASWRTAVESGQGDPMARMVRLLETRPGRRANGSVVYPYLAVKDPMTWDDADAAVAAQLGFTPEDVEQTRRKGRYLDQRLTFAPDGTWTGFAIGG